MSERWRRELEKLRTVGAPSSMRARIDAGPTGDGVPLMPGRRQRVLAGVVAFLVFGGAIALAWGAFGRASSPVVGTTGQQTVTITLHGGRGPSASLRFGDRTADPQVSSYCWSSESSTTCADTVLRAFEPDEFVQIPVGTSVSLDSDTAEVVLGVTAASDPRANALAIPLRGSFADPGRFVLTVTATWPEGDVQFFFPVDVVATDASPTTPTDLVALLHAPSDGSIPTLTLTYGATSEGFFAQAGSWPGVDGFDQPLQVFSIPVAAGSHLRVEGDARNWVVDIKREGTADSKDTEGEAILGIPGTYLLTFKGVWDEGTVGFPVQIEVRDPETSPAPSPPSPSSEESPSDAPVTVPDVIGMTDERALKTLFDLGVNPLVAYRSVEGEQWHVVQMDPPAGSEITTGLEVRLVVASEITPLPDGVADLLVCPTDERVAFGGPHAVLLPAGETFIRANTSGIRDTDQVTQVGAEWSQDLWSVVRDGATIAIVDDGTLDGVACVGSGVGAA